MQKTVRLLDRSLTYQIVETTGEIHYSPKLIPLRDGYRLWRNSVWPILTQYEIDNMVLPLEFGVVQYLTYPDENTVLFPKLADKDDIERQAACERIARVKIAKNLNLFGIAGNQI